MQTQTNKKTKKPYAIKQESVKKVCNALIEISYFNEQETVESKWLRAICNENKVPMLFNAMLTLGYLKKLKHSVYQVMYSREIVNEKLAIKMYKQYNKLKRCVNQINDTKKSIEQASLPSIPAPTIEPKIIEQVIEQQKESEQKNLLFALVREEDIFGAPMYESLEQLKQNPPQGYGRYVVVSVGRRLEIKPQVILD